MPLAVEIQDVSKRFRLYHQKYTSLKERVIHAGRTPFTDLWALRDISVEIDEGSTVGILGRNGSGKSTLLKCLCGVLQPTSGQVVVRGKLAGLLELGAGFQPDLTGRQNIYLNGSLLGLSRTSIDRVFDEIVAFAELEQFIDNQVKFYSSGMYVRLGFAVAVNVDPDVLVIDEVLAVGDERFQRKCLERVKEFQDDGRTIVFVSHSADQVRGICDKAVVLNAGVLVGHGSPGEAVRIFREHLLEANDPLAAGEAAGLIDPGSSRTRMIRITGVAVEHPGLGQRSYLVTGEPLKVVVDFVATERTALASFVIEVRDRSGTVLLRTTSDEIGSSFDAPAGPGTVSFAFETFPFLDGAYDISAGVEHRSGGELHDWKERAATVEVMNPSRSLGVVSLPVTVSLEGNGAGGESFPRSSAPVGLRAQS
ncbi:MAG: ABC transporter ATP-binding protein [Acidimicrobiales bacterium]